MDYKLPVVNMRKTTSGKTKSGKAQLASRNLLMSAPEIESLTILYEKVVFLNYKVNWAVSVINHLWII